MAKKSTTRFFGVGHITICVTIHKGVVKTVYTTRFGFAGGYVQDEIKKMSAELKKSCCEAISRNNPDVDKLISRAKIHYTECECIF
jgi:hypothetical protein